jgi:hypothetical protein
MTDRFTRRVYLALAEGRELSADDATHLAACAICQAAAARAREFEQLLHDEIMGLRAPMPADPFVVTETPRRSRALVPGLTVGLVVLLAGMVGAGLLAGQDRDLSPEPSALPSASASSLTPSPSPSPSPTPQPTTTPSPSPEPTAEEAFQAGDYAVVPIAQELLVYDGPDGTAFAQALPGSELYVIGVRDGWLEVEAQLIASYEFVFGWVRAPALERREPSVCLQMEPGSYVWFGSGTHPQRDLDCYGRDGQVVVRGYAIDRTGDPAPPYTGEPVWLAGDAPLELTSAIGPAVTGNSIFLHLPPELEGTIPTSDREGFEGTLLSVVGHFHDSRSSGCSLVPLAEGHPPVEPRNADLWCRQRFVVDAVEIVEPED